MNHQQTGFVFDSGQEIFFEGVEIEPVKFNTYSVKCICGEHVNLNQMMLDNDGTYKHFNCLSKERQTEINELRDLRQELIRLDNERVKLLDLNNQ